MKNGELAQLCNGVAALDVENLCAQFLPTADGTGVKVELRLCGAYLRVGNAENVGRLVRVVIECYACLSFRSYIDRFVFQRTAAMASTSTSTPLGSCFTATQERAGQPVK